jgi:predicted ATP-dependent endonuclease of OLD family
MVILKKLTLKNFKGIREFSFSPDAKSTNIFGDNGSGKTTLADAFAWLLTGKDSQDAGDFEIKRIVAGKMAAQEHSVEAILDVDGKEIALKKFFPSRWAKNCRLKDYQEVIDDICPPELLKSLLTPGFFNSMDTSKKRRTLLEVCGNVTFQDVIDSNPHLSDLP